MATASSAARRERAESREATSGRHVTGVPSRNRPTAGGRARPRASGTSKKAKGKPASRHGDRTARGRNSAVKTTGTSGTALTRRSNADTRGRVSAKREPVRSVKARANQIASEKPQRSSSKSRQYTNRKAIKPSTRRGAKTATAVSTRSAVARTEPAYFVLVATVALLLLGLVMVFSAGSIIGMGQSVGGYRYFLMQLGWAVLGIALMVFFWKFDYHKLGKISWLGVVLSIALLGVVLFKGTSAFGARRWLSVGPISLQPTEIAKFTMIIFAAYVLAMKGDKLKQIFHLFVPVLILVLIEGALILKQPDMGSTLVLCFSVMVVFVVAKTKSSHLVAIGATGATAALYFALSAPYRRERLFSFVNPWTTPRGAGYQVIQSYIALGSGHIKGLGLGMSRQKFLYLPNAHTDFIFAIIGEELGLLGTMVVLALIGILAYGGVRIASRAPDELGRLLAIGITGLIVIQGLVNMGGVTGLLPITGVPLPLVSSGGSSLCVCLGCIGILLNIAAQSHR
jgi:cell division protein FtsW